MLQQLNSLRDRIMFVRLIRVLLSVRLNYGEMRELTPSFFATSFHGLVVYEAIVIILFVEWKYQCCESFFRTRY